MCGCTSYLHRNEWDTRTLHRYSSGSFSDNDCVRNNIKLVVVCTLQYKEREVSRDTSVVLLGLPLPLLFRKFHIRLLWYCVVLPAQLNRHKYHVVRIINYCH